jgi:chloramphenicol O-acetyltransferase type A
MIKRKVNIEEYKYKNMYEYFVRQKSLGTCVSGNFDITNLYKQKGKHKLNAMLCFCILQAAQNIDEFHYAIDQDKILCYYKNVRTDVIVVGQDGEQYYADIKYFKHFKNFEKQYDKITDFCIKNCESYQKDNGALIATSAIINYPFTNISIDTQDDFWDNFMLWGKYIKNNEKVELNMSLRFNHATIDGNHAGMFFCELQKQFDNFKA